MIIFFVGRLNSYPFITESRFPLTTTKHQILSSRFLNQDQCEFIDKDLLCLTALISGLLRRIQVGGDLLIYSELCAEAEFVFCEMTGNVKTFSSIIYKMKGARTNAANNASFSIILAPASCSQKDEALQANLSDAALCIKVTSPHFLSSTSLQIDCRVLVAYASHARWLES